jgi:drug/metabolite transporter (DMT)-like permease
MNKNFVISVVVMFVLSMAVGMVVHGLLLGQEYAKLVPNLFRSPEDAHRHFGAMIAANVLMAIGWTWIYRQGREAKPWLMQGVRFGIAVAVLCTVPMYLIYYAVQPMPSDVVALQVAYDLVASVLMGIVVAAVNRDAPTRA